MMKIVAVNVGKRKSLLYQGRLINTGIFKYPVSKPVHVGATGLENDAIVDMKHHGGYQQAVYGYALEHYDFWKKKYPDLNWSTGMFGENLTIEGLEEKEIHVGDQFALEEVILEVTKPREPCMKLGLRFETQTILKEFWNDTKCGVYFKVIKEGKVEAGEIMTKIIARDENPTISEVYTLKRNK